MRLAHTQSASERLFRDLSQLIESSQWSLARVATGGVLSHIFVSGPPEALPWHQSVLRAEYRKMSASAELDATISDTSVSVKPYSFGLTMAIAHEGAWRGLVLLVRKKELGPFSPDERERLAQAVPDIGRWLGSSQARSRRVRVFVVDSEMRVVTNAAQAHDGNAALDTLFRPVDRRLSPQLAQVVRSLLREDSPAGVGARARVIVDDVTVEIHAMAVPACDRFWIVAEQCDEEGALDFAAHKFALSNREVSVLELLLSGASTHEVAQRLDIAEATARDHVKRLLAKTGARNRVEIAAKALGFDAHPMEPLRATRDL